MKMKDKITTQSLNSFVSFLNLCMRKSIGRNMQAFVLHVTHLSRH